MSLTREDMLRELELLPVWRLNAPLEQTLAIPLQAKQEEASSDAPVAPQIEPVVEAVAEIKEALPQEVEVQAAKAQTSEIQAAGLPDIANMDWAELKQHVVGTGDQNAEWVFVGDVPTDGDAGVLLDKMLIAIQLHRGKNVYLTQLSEPAYFERQIALIQPKLIVAFGEQVAQRILDSNEPLDVLRGKVHRYQDFSVIASYAPSHLLEHIQDKAKAWSDLCLARSFMQDVK
jgi:DNA polymerase